MPGMFSDLLIDLLPNKTQDDSHNYTLKANEFHFIIRMANLKLKKLEKKISSHPAKCKEAIDPGLSF
jgi:hypothetical protein